MTGPENDPLWAAEAGVEPACSSAATKSVQRATAGARSRACELKGSTAPSGSDSRPPFVQLLRAAHGTDRKHGRVAKFVSARDLTAAKRRNQVTQNANVR